MSKYVRIESVRTKIECEGHADWRGNFELSQVLDAKDRKETIARLGKKVEQDGPFEAFICKMVQPPGILQVHIPSLLPTKEHEDGRSPFHRASPSPHLPN